MKRLRQEIDEDRLRPVYLLSGPDIFLKERAVREICRKIVTPELKEFNLDVLYGDETDAATIVDRAASLPMMAERRVVVVRNVDRLPIEERRKILEYSASSEKRKLLEELENRITRKGKGLPGQQQGIDPDAEKSVGPEAGPEREKLLSERDDLLAEKRKILKRLAFAFPHACLLLMAGEGDIAKIFYRGAGRKKTSRGRTSGQKTAGAGRKAGKASGSGSGSGGKDTPDEPWLNGFADRIVAEVHFRSPSESKIPEAVDQLARERGKSIAPRAVKMLVQAVGSDLVALDNELAKLSIFVAERREIEPQDVESVVGVMKVRSVWDLCDAVLSGSAGKSFSLLGRLLESGLAVPQLSGALRWRFSRLVSGSGRGRAHRKPGASEECLEKAYDLLYEAELTVNTGRRSARMAMTLLVDQLCRLFASADR